MSKLLSDEELLAEIDVLTDNLLAHGIGAKDSYDTRIFDLINTQKRLYAESAVGKKQPTCKYIVDFEHIATNWPPRQAESKDKVDDQL